MGKVTDLPRFWEQLKTLPNIGQQQEDTLRRYKTHFLKVYGTRFFHEIQQTHSMSYYDFKNDGMIDVLTVFDILEVVHA